MRRLRARTSLLAEFAVVSFVALVVLGVVLAQTFLRTTKQEERDQALQVASLTARADIRPRIPAEDVATTLGHAERDLLDDKLDATADRSGVEGVTIWDRGAEVVYSTTGAPSTRVEDSPHVKKALAGQTETVVGHETALGTSSPKELVQVYLPLKTDNGVTAGAVEVDFVYDHLVAGHKEDQKTILGVLAGSLGVIYLLMLGTVARSSRTHHRQARETEHQAVHDALTGLHNRAYFRERVEQAISEGKVSGERACLMLIDLDRFKEVNDTLGHH
ncbi:MAG TPA: GGDEF domain-containing protein, partial [Actinomycetota bacterium]|nr:GGDEF domain-containing protein [Actinomycetota bacterium]